MRRTITWNNDDQDIWPHMVLLSNKSLVRASYPQNYALPFAQLLYHDDNFLWIPAYVYKMSMETFIYFQSGKGMIIYSLNRLRLRAPFH